VINVLELIYIFDFVLFEKTCPQDVPLGPRSDEVKTSHFQWVYHSIVDVRRVMHFEIQKLSRLQVWLLNLDNTGHFSWQLALDFEEGRVRKKHVRIPSLELTLNERNSLIGRSH